jgi:hypothetical protein
MQQIERCTCGTVLPFENAPRLGDRTPCPSCGSTSRAFEQVLEAETVSMLTSLGLKAKSPGEREPWLESFLGAHWSSKFQKFMQKCRIIDRRAIPKHYFE